MAKKGWPDSRKLLARAAKKLGGREGGDPAFFSRLGYRYGTIARIYSELYGAAR
jgi:hypothetical protein